MQDKQERKLRRLIRELLRDYMDEATTSAAVPGYSTPFAFSKKDSEDDEISDFIRKYLDLDDEDDE